MMKSVEDFITLSVTFFLGYLNTKENVLRNNNGLKNEGSEYPVP